MGRLGLARQHHGCTWGASQILFGVVQGAPCFGRYSNPPPRAAADTERPPALLPATRPSSPSRRGDCPCLQQRDRANEATASPLHVVGARAPRGALAPRGAQLTQLGGAAGCGPRGRRGAAATARRPRRAPRPRTPTPPPSRRGSTRQPARGDANGRALGPLAGRCCFESKWAGCDMAATGKDG